MKHKDGGESVNMLTKPSFTPRYLVTRKCMRGGLVETWVGLGLEHQFDTTIQHEQRRQRRQRPKAGGAVERIRTRAEANMAPTRQ